MEERYQHLLEHNSEYWKGICGVCYLPRLECQKQLDKDSEDVIPEEILFDLSDNGNQPS